jgi:hypothetical protein
MERPRENTAPKAPAGREAGAAAVHALVLAALLGALWCVDYLPTQDGPQHVFSVHALHRLDDPRLGYGRWLEPGTPVTNLGFHWVYGALERLLPWRQALSLALALQLAVWSAGAFALARSVGTGRAWLGVALSAAALQWSLYMGLFSYHLATGLGLVAVAVGAAAPRWSTRRALTLAALLLVQALGHVVPAIATGFVLAAVALARAPRGARLRALLQLGAIGAPAACVALALASVGLAALGDYTQGTTGPVLDPGPAPWWALARCFTSGPAWRAWPLTLLALASPLIALAARTPRRVEDRALLAAGTTLLVAAALLPLHLRAWDFFSVRFIPLGVACCVVALPFERLMPSARRIAAASLAGFALASTAWAAGYHRELEARAAEALAGLDARFAVAGPRLPIVLDAYLGRPLDDAAATVPFAVPLLNLGALYAVAQGGVPAYGFYVNPQIHGIVRREGTRALYPHIIDRRYAIDLALPARANDTAMRRAIVALAAGYGAGYEDVILYGRPDDVDWLLSLGFVPEFREGGLALARFEGCPVTLRFPPGSDVREDTVVEMGWFPAWHATRRYRVGSGWPDPDGGIRLPLRETPCGGLWFRLDDEERRCEGADPEGHLVVASSRATPVVECRVLSASLRRIAKGPR